MESLRQKRDLEGVPTLGSPPVTLSGPKTADTVPRVRLRKQCAAPGPFFAWLRKFAHLV